MYQIKHCFKGMFSNLTHIALLGKFNGETTANWELFNNRKLITVHCEIPFGTNMPIINIKVQTKYRLKC